MLDFPLFMSICLFASSATITLAVNALRRGEPACLPRVVGESRSRWRWPSSTGTGLEWKRLIVEKGLTIRTNLFGTTFYSLVGLHAFHVIVGTLFFVVVLALALAGRVVREHAARTHVLALYWHFVDAVWVVVLAVVYVIGR